MTAPVLIKSFDCPSFDMKEALSYLGPNEDVEGARELLQKCFDVSAGSLIYKTCYAEYEIRKEGDGIDLGFMKLHSEALEKYLKGCFGIVLFAATVGVGMDRAIAARSYSSPWQACALDAVGSERVETLCNRLCAFLAEEYEKKGVGLKNRFSPGYADFPLESQREVFAALDPTSRLGIVLNDSMIMSPAKSVTAIIGLYRK